MNLFDFKIGRSLAPLLFPAAQADSSAFPASLGLSDIEISFFQKNGYIVKRGVIEKDLCDQAVDETWHLLPKHFMRDSPSTWRGNVSDSLCQRGVDDRKGRVKFRECVRHNRNLYEMIDRNPEIRSTLGALLGADRVPQLPYIRGLYPVFPTRCPRYKTPRPHTDGHRFMVGTLGYLSDVEPNGGGFHVWPGSHLMLQKCFKKLAGSGWTNDYHRELYLMAKKVPAKEIVAPKGSVIFWHHRLAHAAGINRSSCIRHAVLADYPSSDYDRLKTSESGDDPWKGWNFDAKR